MTHKLLDHSLTIGRVDAGEQRQQQRRTTLLHAPNLQTHPFYLLVKTGPPIPGGFGFVGFPCQWTCNEDFSLCAPVSGIGISDFLIYTLCGLRALFQWSRASLYITQHAALQCVCVCGNENRADLNLQPLILFIVTRAERWIGPGAASLKAFSKA